jgi:hypothetical protein
MLNDKAVQSVHMRYRILLRTHCQPNQSSDSAFRKYWKNGIFGLLNWETTNWSVNCPWGRVRRCGGAERINGALWFRRLRGSSALVTWHIWTNVQVSKPNFHRPGYSSLSLHSTQRQDRQSHISLVSTEKASVAELTWLLKKLYQSREERNSISNDRNI